MPERNFNVFKSLSEIVSELRIGDKIITNGDSGFAQDRYYSGTIKAINGNRIEIARDDNQEGGGENGEWVIKNKANSPIKTLILDPDGGRSVPRSRIQFGDVVNIMEETYVVMELLPHNRILVRRFFRHDSDNSMAIIVESTIKFLFHFSELRCRDCDAPATRTVNGMPYCERHLAEYGRVVQCATCGQSIWHNASQANGGDERYCERCYREIREQNRAINNYSFKPVPQFITVVPEPKELADRLFHGVENEVELGDDYPDDDDGDDDIEYDENDEPIEQPRRVQTTDRERLAQELKKLVNKKRKWIYIKSDGSLNNGFEVVTEPATVEAHLSLPWDKVCGFYHKNGIIADNTTTCGLHVHVNKSVLNEEAQIKLAYFVATQKSKMEKVARRPANNWAMYKDARTSLTQIHKSGGKYEALNWSPVNTVEFRLFKGTVNQHIMLASVEFTQACILFTSSVSMDILKEHAKAWKAFVKFCDERKYKHLRSYLVERGVAA